MHLPLSAATSPVIAVSASESRWKAGSLLCCTSDSLRKLNRYTVAELLELRKFSRELLTRRQVGDDPGGSGQGREIPAATVTIDERPVGELGLGRRRQFRDARDLEHHRPLGGVRAGAIRAVSMLECESIDLGEVRGLGPVVEK